MKRPDNNQKKAGVAILILHKWSFKEGSVIRDTEGHFLMIKIVNPPEKYWHRKSVSIQQNVNRIRRGRETFNRSGGYQE